MRVLMTTAAGAALAVAALTSAGLTPTATAATTAPVPGTPAAPGEDKPPNTPTVQPDPASPGTHVWVYDANECTAPNGTATSQALTAPIALAPLANMTGGGGTLREGLAAGTYTITLHCGSTLTTKLRVRTAARTGTAPAGAAAAGDGSAEDHLGVGDAAVGGAFLLGGLAFATASLIRRRRATSRG